MMTVQTQALCDTVLCPAKRSITASTIYCDSRLQINEPLSNAIADRFNNFDPHLASHFEPISLEIEDFDLALESAGKRAGGISDLPSQIELTQRLRHDGEQLPVAYFVLSADLIIDDHQRSKLVQQLDEAKPYSHVSHIVMIFVDEERTERTSIDLNRETCCSWLESFHALTASTPVHLFLISNHSPAIDTTQLAESTADAIFNDIVSIDPEQAKPLSPSRRGPAVALSTFSVRRIELNLNEITRVVSRRLLAQAWTCGFGCSHRKSMHRSFRSIDHWLSQTFPTETPYNAKQVIASFDQVQPQVSLQAGDSFYSIDVGRRVSPVKFRELRWPMWTKRLDSIDHEITIGRIDDLLDRTRRNLEAQVEAEQNHMAETVAACLMQRNVCRSTYAAIWDWYEDRVKDEFLARLSDESEDEPFEHQLQSLATWIEKIERWSRRVMLTASITFALVALFIVIFANGLLYLELAPVVLAICLTAIVPLAGGIYEALIRRRAFRLRDLALTAIENRAKRRYCSELIGMLDEVRQRFLHKIADFRRHSTNVLRSRDEIIAADAPNCDDSVGRKPMRSDSQNRDFLESDNRATLPDAEGLAQLVEFFEADNDFVRTIRSSLQSSIGETMIHNNDFDQQLVEIQKDFGETIQRRIGANFPAWRFLCKSLDGFEPAGARIELAYRFLRAHQLLLSGQMVRDAKSDLSSQRDFIAPIFDSPCRHELSLVFQRQRVTSIATLELLSDTPLT